MKIALGTIVRDRVTGLIGVAENRSYYLHGCDRYCVQPPVGEDGKVPDSCMFDYPQLEIVEGKEKAMDALPEPAELVVLGQIVHDPIRDMSGTVTGRAVYLNGCARVFIQPKQSGEFEIKPWWTDEAVVIPKKKLLGGPHINSPADTKRRTGGPAPSSKY